MLSKLIPYFPLFQIKLNIICISKFNTSFLLQNNLCEFHNTNLQIQEVILYSKPVLNVWFKDF